MEAIRSRKEMVVISFFWFVLVFVALMAIGNGIKHLKASGRPEPAGQTAGSGSSASQEADLKRMIEENPGDLNAMIRLGDIYYDGNEPLKSIEIFEMAKKINADSIHVQTDLAMLYMKVNRPDDAAARFNDVLRIRPEDLKAHYYLGYISRFNKNDDTTALEHFRKILQANPNEALKKAALKQINEIERDSTL